MPPACSPSFCPNSRINREYWYAEMAKFPPGRNTRAKSQIAALRLAGVGICSRTWQLTTRSNAWLRNGRWQMSAWMRSTESSPRVFSLDRQDLSDSQEKSTEINFLHRRAKSEV